MQGAELVAIEDLLIVGALFQLFDGQVDLLQLRLSGAFFAQHQVNRCQLDTQQNMQIILQLILMTPLLQAVGIQNKSLDPPPLQHLQQLLQPQAHLQAGLQLGPATLVNLRSMGIAVAGQEETA